LGQKFDKRHTPDIKVVDISNTNKLGIALMALGAVLVASFKWANPVLTGTGLILLLLGLYFAFKNRKASDISDGSTRHTSADLDGDD